MIVVWLSEYNAPQNETPSRTDTATHTDGRAKLHWDRLRNQLHTRALSAVGAGRGGVGGHGERTSSDVVVGRRRPCARVCVCVATSESGTSAGTCGRQTGRRRTGECAARRARVVCVYSFDPLSSPPIALPPVNPPPPWPAQLYPSVGGTPLRESDAAAS